MNTQDYYNLGLSDGKLSVLSNPAEFGLVAQSRYDELVERYKSLDQKQYSLLQHYNQLQQQNEKFREDKQALIIAFKNWFHSEKPTYEQVSRLLDPMGNLPNYNGTLEFPLTECPNHKTALDKGFCKECYCWYVGHHGYSMPIIHKTSMPAVYRNIDTPNEINVR